jgi:hypothetical protein
MTNTPPSNNNDDTVKPAEPETPVFDEVATDHPEVEEAAPSLVEPEQPAPASDPVPLVEPEAPEPVSGSSLSRPVEPVETTPTQEAHTDTAEAAGYEEHVEEPRVAEERPAAASAPAPMQTVYVTAPVAPKAKGNRGFGLLFAFIATLAFAVLFAAVIALIMLIDPPQSAFGGSILGFISSSAFWVPVAVYFVVFVLFALIVNRGGWASWVLSSFLLAAIVYFASIAVILLLEGVVGMTPTDASRGFGQLALSAPLIVVAILAREVTIWFGAAIARRGRKVKERNLEARAAYERELDNQPLGFS